MARLPFWLLYRISDLLFVLIYGLGYRKRVVLQNLRNSFPEKTPAEIRTICRDFYRFFCDLLLETCKVLTISPEEAIRRVDIDNFSVIDRQLARGKDVIVVLGHYGNWELAGAAFSFLGHHRLSVIYKPLTNQAVDRLLIHMRTRSGTELIPVKETTRTMERNRGTGSITAFIADQTPPPDKAYWMTFLHQDTPVFLGTEGLAKRFDQPVVYLEINRPRRGHYDVSFELLVENPRDTADGEITERHTRHLEQAIRRRPELWLWTHRRWKHRRPSP